MKRIILVVLLFPIVAFSQTKKDAKVIVGIADTSNIMSRIASVFYERGYSIDHRDDAGGFVSTKEKAINSGIPTEVKLRVLVKGSQITITGEYRMNVNIGAIPPAFEPIAYRGGMKGSVNRLVWEEIEAIANAFGTEIKYSK